MKFQNFGERLVTHKRQKISSTHLHKKVIDTDTDTDTDTDNDTGTDINAKTNNTDTDTELIFSDILRAINTVTTSPVYDRAQENQRFSSFVKYFCLNGTELLPKNQILLSPYLTT